MRGFIHWLFIFLMLFGFSSVYFLFDIRTSRTTVKASHSPDKSLRQSPSTPVQKSADGPISVTESDKVERRPLSLEEIKRENERALYELGKKYKTDKVTSHAYHVPYAHFFDRTAVRKILEIGIANGNSIRLWLDYFPNAEVHGMDVFMRDDRWRIQSERFHPWLGSMTNRSYLRWFVKQHKNDPFDIIIDDGSHSRLSNQLCWEELFPSPILKDEGYYAIEDLGVGYLRDRPKSNATTDIAKQWIDVIQRAYFGDYDVARSYTAKSIYLMTERVDHQIESMYVSDQLILLKKRIKGPQRGTSAPPDL